MVPKADLSAKETLDQTAEAWVRWILADQKVEVEASLSTEFQFVGRRSDSLFQVRGKVGRFLALTEIQLRHDPEMPRRMRAYAALAEQKYRQPVLSYRGLSVALALQVGSRGDRGSPGRTPPARPGGAANRGPGRGQPGGL